MANTRDNLDRHDNDLTNDVDETREELRNEDPITGEAGSHPVATGAGAALGGVAAGAAAGMLGGPVGTAVGAIVGGVAGGLAGKAVGEQIDPTVEDAYWRDEYRNRDYVDADAEYDTYQPAYRYGWESRQSLQNRTWDEVEPELGRGWTEYRGESQMEWDKARPATQDAWQRLEQYLPGDADNDGDYNPDDTGDFKRPLPR
jgi:hypothetical protein